MGDEEEDIEYNEDSMMYEQQEEENGDESGYYGYDDQYEYGYDYEEEGGGDQEYEYYDEHQYEEVIERIPDEHIEENQCAICIENKRTHAAVPCGHFNLCLRCCEQIRLTTNKCPICRRNIDSFLKIYK